METAFEPVPIQRGLQARQIGADHRLQIGIEGGGRGAFEFTDFGQDFARRNHIVIGPERAHRLHRRLFIGGIGIGIDEDHCDRFGPLGQQLLGRAAHLCEIDRLVDRAIGQHALGHFQPHVTIGNRGKIAP